MTRAVPLWFGKTAGTPVPDRVRVRVFARYNGRCQCGCYRAIRSGEAWQLDHKQALINGGPHAEDNLWPLLSEHHKEKTADDVAVKSKTARMAKKHLGIKKSGRPMVGSKASPWKRKMNGELVRR